MFCELLGERAVDTSTFGVQRCFGDAKREECIVSLEMTKARLADLLEGFVNGTCGKGEWDAFLSVRHEDPDVEKIRDHCELLDIEFPARKLGQFCNEEGGKVLLNYARRLREESTS